MNNRSGISLILPCETHRRSRSKLAEMEALRRELARLDNIEDHVLDVVVDRLLEELDLPGSCAQPRVFEPKPLVLVHVAPDCVAQTMGRGGPVIARV